MSDDPTTLPVATPQAPAAPAEPAPSSDDTSAETASREAARYRRALRSTETERDALLGRVKAMQTREVERLASASGVARPASIWAATDLATLVDADGDVDPDLARQAIDTAVESLGLSVRSRMTPDLSQGARGSVPAEPDSWATLLMRKG